jgi:putative sigma-54 modulation protein
MKISINSVHFDADKKLLEFIEEKINKLEKFNDSIIDCEVFLRLDNNHNNENKITEVKMNIKGKEVFVKKQRKSFEEATDEAVDTLKRQMKKYKEKAKSF